MSNAMTFAAFRAASGFSRALPGFVSDDFARPIGFGANVLRRERRGTIERHLRRVDPSLDGWQLRQAVKQAFDSYARYWIESFRLPTTSARIVDAGFSVEGYEHITQGLARRRGVILALPHLGGWEWAGRWLADNGNRVTAIVEQIDPPELFDWFARLRNDLGMTVVPLGPDAGRAVLRALAGNEIVCLLCDRHIGGSGGVDVEFFGEHTTLPAGPATIALRADAPLLPVGVYFTPQRNGHHAIVRPPVSMTREGRLRDDVARVTQTLTTELEWLIRRAPSQWHLFQPNWPSDPGYRA